MGAVRRLSPMQEGEKPNPISIPGPWPCGLRTARGFSFLAESRVKSQKPKILAIPFSTLG